MKVYKILYSIEGIESFKTNLFVTNSQVEAIEELTDEVEKKYNPETSENLTISKIERL